jgi:hypothetical protein
MCRSIKTLRGSENPPETPNGRAEMEAAALQYVRKISGYRVPSRANQEAFDRAVQEVADATQRLLESLAPASRYEIPDRQQSPLLPLTSADHP